ncbi:lysophospholipid acyltransferase family protein [Hydrogenophaga sp.]|uniref:lysophospholipid acyltransferase family protein n=1 Tax=Hydrogenophaga sp. TaxID=1904254 RepID=UPI00272FBF0E|nr:lipid A biosynthesis acyltransferase [Hydrogenophaga sp.]MDP1684434.1 lipid A biosynthesis acyltransferase [Hydrogenophaga sp.]
MSDPSPVSAHQLPPGGIANRLGVVFMRLLAALPLSWVRALGWLLGQVLHVVAARRRRIARTNWGICFPGEGEAERNRAVRRHFVFFAQAWLDRSWLWEASDATIRGRLKLTGDLQALAGNDPTVMFAPHFVGMDAGWTALTAHLERRFCGIYAEQLNADVDRWMAQGRQRFGDPHIVAMRQGLKPLVAALRQGLPMYLLPDMDYGTRDSVFVPFFGVQTATITSLSRFARMARARVVPVVSRLTKEGYEVTVHSPWPNYPTGDVEADTATMNTYLEGFIRDTPEQYYWVHKRFKTRPEGEASFYAGL